MEEKRMQPSTRGGIASPRKPKKSRSGKRGPDSSERIFSVLPYPQTRDALGRIVRVLALLQEHLPGEDEVASQLLRRGYEEIQDLSRLLKERLRVAQPASRRSSKPYGERG